jgi:hypothetical protein
MVGWHVPSATADMETEERRLWLREPALGVQARDRGAAARARIVTMMLFMVA